MDWRRQPNSLVGVLAKVTEKDEGVCSTDTLPLPGGMIPRSPAWSM